MKKRILPFLMFMLIASMGFSQTHTLLVTVPDSVETVYISGEFNNWTDPANAPADSATLISNSPKIFSIEYTYEGLVDTLEYKFYSGPGWKYEQKNDTSFIVMNDSATAEVDSFKAFYHRAYEKDVLIDVLVPVDVFQVYLTGTFNGWNSTSDKMTQIDSSSNGKEFQLTIHTLDTTTLEYKFLAGPGWPYEQKNAGNYIYMTDGGTVICDEFKAIFDPSKVGDITINITVPEGTPAVWVIGSFGSGWSLDDAIEATKNEDGTYTAVIPMVADIEYKIWNYPDWPYEEAKDAEGNGLDENRKASFETGPVFDITVAFWKEVYGATGVKDPISASYKMYSVNGTIVIEGVTSTVTVFDINGRMMQNARAKGIFVSRSLQPGIYILRVDNKVQKVAVQ